jgi:uncharacterized protein YegP (UPF0339 family)
MVKRSIIYQARDGMRWRAVASNGNIVAESGEAYSSFFKAAKAAFDYSPPGFEISFVAGAGAARAIKLPNLDVARRISKTLSRLGVSLATFGEAAARLQARLDA